MVSFDFAALRGAVSDAAPCGPDLDLAGDPDYMNFMARVEGLLPTSFFSGPEGRPFDRSSIEFEREYAAVGSFIARTRDLRLLVVLAKLLILNRDLPGLVGCVGLIEDLLAERWDEFHPQPMDGDVGIRMAALESLDDMPPVVFPLQYLPLVNDRRLGPISYRSWMVATGETKPRDGETLLDSGAIEAALAEAELAPLVALRDQVQSLQASLRNIRDICVNRVGAERAAKFEKLPTLAAALFALLDTTVARRDPALATAGVAGCGPGASNARAGDQAASQAATSAGSGSAITSTHDVAAALAAIASYFSRFEPSNPALLLVRQAEQLMGKSFLEAMRVLVPTHLPQAAVRIGKDHVFDLPLEQLAPFAEIAELPPDVTADNLPPRMEARSRTEAIRLLEQIGAYYRIAEPSSPVPFLTERARTFSERDFLGLLSDLLPEGTLKGTRGT